MKETLNGPENSNFAVLEAVDLSTTMNRFFFVDAYPHTVHCPMVVTV